MDLEKNLISSLVLSSALLLWFPVLGFWWTVATTEYVLDGKILATLFYLLVPVQGSQRLSGSVIAKWPPQYSLALSPICPHSVARALYIPWHVAVWLPGHVSAGLALRQVTVK